MNQEYEIIHYPKIKHINIFIDEVTYRSQHLHSDYEFCFCLEGKANFIGLHNIIEINKGEIAFFDSNEVHSIETEGEPLVGLFIQVSNLFIKDYVPELHTKAYMSTNLNKCLSKDDINVLFNKFISVSKKYFKEAANYKINTLDAVFNLINKTFSHVTSHTLDEKSVLSRRKDAERLQRITSFIDSHFQEAITLQDIADSENITTTHLSHLFSKGLGITYQEYLNERRFECAVLLMNSSNKKIIEISYEAGFSDPKYFTKMFKKHFNSTPCSYRKKKKMHKVINSNKNQMMLERIFTNKEALSYLIKISN